MRTVQDVLFGITGQTVYFDAPEGRPSSVTSVKVFSWDSSDDAEEASSVGSPSVETTPNTSIGSATSSGSRSITVDDTSGFSSGRTYLLIADDGHREWIECVANDGTAVIAIKHPLHNAYADGDAAVSTRVQATIDSTWVADSTNLDASAGPNPAYRVRWVYVVSGVSYVADSYFNLVRYAGKHGVRPQDVEATNPGWLDRLPTDHYTDQGRRLIDEAYRSVKIDLHQVWTDDAMVANSEIVDELTRWKTIEATELARILAGVAVSAGYDAARSAYQGRLDSLVRLTAKQPERSASGAASLTAAVGLSRR